MLFSKELQLLAQMHKTDAVCVSQHQHCRAVRRGAGWGPGLAVLPAFLADRDPLLQRVMPEQAKFERTFWMSMPEEAKGLLRIQTVWRLLKQVMAEYHAGLRPV